MSNNHKSLVCGVGVNDMDGMSTTTEYIKWSSMIKRCYSTKWILENRPSYIGASVSQEWLLFSNYYNDYQENYCDGFVLDKDILIYGNKHYSPQSCVFVPEYINLIVVCKPREDRLFGVTKNKHCFSANITITGENVPLGRFETELAAHQAWQKAKAQIFLAAAEDYANEYRGTKHFHQGVYDSLFRRAWDIAEDYENNRPTLKY